MSPDPNYAAHGVFDSDVLKKAGIIDPSSPHTIKVATLMLVRRGLAEQTKGQSRREFRRIVRKWREIDRPIAGLSRTFLLRRLLSQKKLD